jgi:hypothetical protein
LAWDLGFGMPGSLEKPARELAEYTLVSVGEQVIVDEVGTEQAAFLCGKESENQFSTA